MQLFSEQNIAKISFICAIILVVVLTVSTGSLFIAKKINTLSKDLDEIERAFIEEQKTQLKNDVSGLLRRVKARRSSMSEKIRQQLKVKVEETVEIARHIYQSMEEHLEDDEIAGVIREAVRPVRFAEEQGYFFIIGVNGEVILYPARPELEGTNFLEDTSGEGAYVVANMIRIAGTQKTGFFEYDWGKPGDDSGKLYPKISCVSFFEPYFWIFGTGEYKDNLDRLARKTITQDLKNSLKGQTEDYYFVYELHNLAGGKDFATMLINSNRPDLVGNKLSDDYTDARGNFFRKKFLEGIRNDGEAFVVYWYKKPGSEETGRKLSYFKYYPEWNWVIARGIYFDRLDEVITQKKQELRLKVKNDIILLSIILLVGLGVAVSIAYSFSHGLQRIFDRYKVTQQEHLDKLENLNRELERQSRTDTLTKTYNRRYFNLQLEREMARARRYETPLSLILFDLDHFKRINDQLGHLAGDGVLQEVAQLVQDNIRHTDFLARWGGEEFVILAPGVDLSGAGKFGEKLRVLIEKRDYSVQRTVTSSFGVTTYQPPEKSAEFLQRSDDALYQAKQEGRNKVVIL